MIRGNEVSDNRMGMTVSGMANIIIENTASHNEACGIVFISTHNNEIFLNTFLGNAIYNALSL